jgi:hypothetical protein
VKICTVMLEGISHYSQSRMHSEPALEQESADEYAKRTALDHLHFDSKGHVFIPPMSIKQSIDNAAKYMQQKVPGKGQATYTKHFKSGLAVVEPLMLFDSEGNPVMKSASPVEKLWLNSDGVRGGGKRVWKYCPYIPSGWTAELQAHILDDTIGEEVFLNTLVNAGRFIGLGRFRPASGGYYGRFTYKPDSVNWEVLRNFL